MSSPVALPRAVALVGTTLIFPPPVVSTSIVNRGTGAGGSNTNASGLAFEKRTSLDECFDVVSENRNGKTVKFHDSDITLIRSEKGQFIRSMNDIRNSDIILASGCKQPDESFFNTAKSRAVIIEKKMQNKNGSVDEKIQTGAFKKFHYNTLYPQCNIAYAYCLSNWFKKKEYRSVIEYLRANGVYVFWGEDEDYKTKMKNFVLSKFQ